MHDKAQLAGSPVDLTAYYPQFSLAERDRRWNAVRTAMALDGIDVLLVIANDSSFGMATANLRYLTQIGSLCGGEALFFLDRDPIVWNGNQPQMHYPTNAYEHTQNWVRDIRLGSGLAGIAAEIRQLGYDRGRIGVAPFSSTLFRTPYIFAEHQRILERELPNAQLVPAGSLMERVRLIKSEEEIAMLARAAEVSRKAVDAMIGTAQPGATEAAVMAEMTKAQIVNGGEPQIFNFLSSGPVEHPSEEIWRLLHGSEPPAGASMRPIGRGDIVITEFHTAVGGYLAGAEFTVYVGEKPPDRLRRIWDASVEVLEASRQALRPGMTLREAWTAIRKPVLDRGLDYVELGFHGHGLASPEFPTVVHAQGAGGPASMDGTGIGDLVLQEGMVFGNNIDVYDSSWKQDVGCMFGDTMVVRDGTAQTMVGVPTELPHL